MLWRKVPGWTWELFLSLVSFKRQKLNRVESKGARLELWLEEVRTLQYALFGERTI